MTDHFALTANYKGGKFMVSYDFLKDPSLKLEIYDRIEIKELTTYVSSSTDHTYTTINNDDDRYDHDHNRNNLNADDATVIAVQVTNSTLAKDVVEISCQYLKDKETGAYCYASFVNATEDKEIARSDIFFANYCNEENNDTNEEEISIILHRDEDIFELQLVSLDAVHHVDDDDHDDGVLASKQNCELTIHWQYTPVKMPGGKEDYKSYNILKNHVSVSDWIVVLPTSNNSDMSSRQEYVKNHYYQGAYVLASGEMSGTVTLRLAGYCIPGVEYQVFYYDTALSVCRGASETFTVDSSLLPTAQLYENDAVGGQEQEDMKQQSQLFNSMAMMRYEIQKQMDTMKKDHLSYNPLLTIVPKPGKWEKLMEQENQRGRENRMMMEEEDASNNYDRNHNFKDSSAADAVALDGETMEKITNELRQKKKVFLFLGAGVSVAPPASAPSWWTLMSTVLEETFKAVPIEHQKVARKLATSDATRSPEEVMETYYFVLQDKLFSLFRLLKEGKPNANHRIVAKMAKRGMLQSVLTTNFDEFIEEALDDEGLSYQVICTMDEFKTFLRSGCKGFAVLKIHGTVSRPDTIVAVANHYKGGKGFSGLKATVTHHFMKYHPTIFLGYSGWDFVHANYQEFWKNVGDSGGEMVYFVKFQGYQGGPNISKLVGRHIGPRLVLGDGIMPEYLCSIVNVFNPEDALDVMNQHCSVGADVGNSIILKQRDYITRWVGSFSTVAILAILWNESSNLNEITKSRLEKMKNVKGESDHEAMNTAGLTAYSMQLAAQYSQGTISEDEYNEKQRRATIEITLSQLSIEKAKKNELIDLLVHEMGSNSVFNGSNGQALLAMFPSYVMMSADAMGSDASTQEIYDRALSYIVDILLPLYETKDEDRMSEVMYNMRYVHSIFLRIESPESREEAENLIKSYAKDAVDNEWTNDVISEKNLKEVVPSLTRIAYQQIDTQALMNSQVKHVLDLVTQESSLDDILDGAFIIAISMERQAQYLSSDLYSNPKMIEIIQMLSINEEKAIPDEMYESVMSDLSRGVEPILKVLRDFDDAGAYGEKLHPREILATFDLGFIKCIQLCLKHIGDGAEIQNKRERNGFYPFDHLPSSASIYLSNRMENSVKHIKDDRAEQSALAMLVSLAEVTRNIEQMEKAVEASLIITEGKVTELTSPPIPEALAAAYQEDGDMDKALHYYKLALEGVHTFIMREKTDAIVLNACLITAMTDRKAALRTAFDYSPFFSDAQLNIIPKPSRSLLIQQCEAWAEELGMTLSEARRILTESQEQLENSEGLSSNSNNTIEEKLRTKGSSATIELDSNAESASSFKNYQCIENLNLKEKALPSETLTSDGHRPSKKPPIIGGRSCGTCVIM